MKKPATESIPLLRDLLFMDISYLHLRSVKWAPKAAAHLGGEQRSDDDNPPAASTQDPPPSPSKQPDADAIDFLTWDITIYYSGPWDKLSLLLSGSGKFAGGDLPIYVFPALLFAWTVVSSASDDLVLPIGLQAFYNDLEAQIEHDRGEAVETYLDLLNPDKSPETAIRTWERACRARDFTDKEKEYITALWHAARDAYDLAHPASPRPSATSEPGTSEAGRKGTLRARAAAAPAAAVPAAKAAAAPAASAEAKAGRVKKKAAVRTLTRPVAPAASPSVTSDRSKGIASLFSACNQVSPRFC
jgi:hypothetical protein